jgi:hypothetical protein
VFLNQKTFDCENTNASNQTDLKQSPLVYFHRSQQTLLDGDLTQKVGWETLLNLLQDRDIFAEEFEVGNKLVTVKFEEESFLAWMTVYAVEPCFAVPADGTAEFGADVVN